MNELVPVEKKEGVTLYGRVIDSRGKLGQYEVHSDWARYDGIVYNQYCDAEKKMILTIGVYHGKAKIHK